MALAATPASLNLPVILGSIRKGRRSHAAARLVVERIAEAGHRTQLVDLRELNLPMFDEEETSESHAAVAAFRQIIAESDAQVWLTPEYNHGYTAAVKNALDYLHGEIRRKPAVVCGLSSGLVGGARAVEQLKAVLIELHVVPIRESVYFHDARTLFDASGSLLRPEIVDRIDYVIADLVWYAQALRWARENVPVPRRR
jgi:NAD(P)H-dependent FMN reductase